MSNTIKKSIALILSLIIAVSSVGVAVFADEDTGATVEMTVTETDVKSNGLYPYLTSDNINPEETSNAVIIPGVFQSRVRLYNEDGTIATNSDGDEYEAPFFLESTGDIVKMALKKCLVPLLLTLITQHDIGGKLAQSLGDVIGWAVGEKAQCDSTGKQVYNVKADKYEGSVATLTEEQKEYIFDQIPLQDYADIVGEDHLYFYSYCSLSNIDSIVDELYLYIKKAASESPTGKANIVPISQGGSLANNLLQRYPDVGQYLDRIVYIVPALNGTVLIGDLYANGIIDDDDALYNEIFPILINDDNTPWLGSLINIVIRIFPNEVLNDILDKAVDVLVGKYLRYDTTMWALVNQENYEAAAAKYLSNPEDAYIKSQTDVMYQAQVNSDANILNQIETYGVEVFDVVDYNCILYPIADSWKQNGDGVIQLESTSMGAYSLGVDVQLPDDYVPVKGEKYVDSYRIVDAGAGLLPDTTFYFHNQNHERTASNDVIMKLSICLLTDKDFTSVDSYPDKYPQFNEARRSKGFDEDIESAKKLLEKDDISAEDRATLESAIAEAEAQLNNTVVDTEAFDTAKKNLYKISDKINGKSSEPDAGDKISEKANAGLNVIITWLASWLYNTIGGKGFSDIFKLF